MIAAEGAVGNRHRPIVGDAAAITERERIRHTSMVPSDETAADHEHPTAAVDAAARAAASWEAVKCRGVAVDCAVRQLQHRVTAINGIIEDPSPGGGKIAGDSAVKDGQCRAACRTIVVNSATVLGEAVLYRATVYRQCSVIIQDSAAALLFTGTATANGEASDCDGPVGHDVEHTKGCV